MNAPNGPFRHYSWPLEELRQFTRALRILKLRLFGRFRFQHGTSVSLTRGLDVRAPHYFSVGDRVSLGKNFTCETDLQIGSDVLVSSNVSIIGNDHPFDNPAYTVYTHPPRNNSPVEIGSDVLIGFGSTIIGPVRIGDGCVVGAGSIVTKDLPPYTICVGAPAKPIRKRY